jgi:hypothetical protein
MHAVDRHDRNPIDCAEMGMQRVDPADPLHADLQKHFAIKALAAKVRQVLDDSQSAGAFN